MPKMPKVGIMSLYNDVEAVLAKDLGPAAPMFLKRQVGHLKKDSTVTNETRSR